MDWFVPVAVQFSSINKIYILVWNLMFGNLFYLTWLHTSQTLMMTSCASNISFSLRLNYFYKTMTRQVAGQTRAKGCTWYGPRRLCFSHHLLIASQDGSTGAL